MCRAAPPGLLRLRGGERARTFDTNAARGAASGLRVLCGTWNVNGKPPLVPIEDWLFPCAGRDEVDVYVIALQEVQGLSGTAALLSGADWLQSAAWDGRWATAVCSDIAEPAEPFTFLCGAAAVGVLLGPEAVIELQRERVSHILDRWDFYKPVGWHEMAPIVDGLYSVDVHAVP